MKINDKAQILADLYIVTKAMPEWADFHKWADMGVPISMGVVYGYCSLTDKGEELINSTYDMLLKVLEIDDVEYSDLQAVFDASSGDAAGK